MTISQVEGWKWTLTNSGFICEVDCNFLRSHCQQWAVVVLDLTVVCLVILTCDKSRLSAFHRCFGLPLAMSATFPCSHLKQFPTSRIRSNAILAPSHHASTIRRRNMRFWGFSPIRSHKGSVSVSTPFKIIYKHRI